MPQDETLSLALLVATGRVPPRSLDWLMTVEGITRLDQLVRLSRRDLLAMPGVGIKTVALLEAAMAKHGLALAPDPEPDPEPPEKPKGRG